MVSQIEINQRIPLCQVYSYLTQRFGARKEVWIVRCKRTNRFFAQTNSNFDSEKFDLFSAGVTRKHYAEEEEIRFTEYGER